MLDKRCAVPTAVLVERGAAVDPVFVPVAAENQAVALIERQVVLPVHRITVRVEHAAFIAEFVEGLLAVFAVTEFDAGFPDVVDPGIDITADAAHGKVAVRLLLERFEGRRVKAPEWIVELAFAAVIQQVGADFDVVGEGMAQAQTDRFVAVFVMIAVAGIGLVGAVDPGGFIEAGAEVEAGFLIATG